MMDVPTNIDYVEVFKSEASEWCWHALARNGEIVAEGESHTRAEDAVRAASGVFGDGVRIVLKRGNNGSV